MAINYAFGDNGLVRMAEKASEYYLNDSTYTDQSLKNIEDYIDNILAGKGNSTVNNPYGEEEWTYAYVCNDGVWDNTQYTAGQQVEGDIIAKFYATENQIQPSDLYWESNVIPFITGTEYHLVIEGTGNMGQLMDLSSDGSTITNAYGWQTLSAAYLMQYISTGSVPSFSCIMPYVTEITICDGITNIGNLAFAGDTSLNKITISNSVENMGTFILLGCSNLASISIPNSVTSIGDRVFSGCTSLANVTIPSGVTSIGDGAFYGCTSLASISIPNSVTSIENSTFYGCTSLASISIPNSVTSIENRAFNGCTSLASITIPNSVTRIEYGAFNSCTSLDTITFKGTKAEWNNISKVNWNIGSSVTSIICTDGTITL